MRCLIKVITVIITILIISSSSARAESIVLSGTKAIINILDLVLTVGKHENIDEVRDKLIDESRAAIINRKDEKALEQDRD